MAIEGLFEVEKKPSSRETHSPQATVKLQAIVDAIKKLQSKIKDTTSVDNFDEVKLHLRTELAVVSKVIVETVGAIKIPKILQPGKLDSLIARMDEIKSAVKILDNIQGFLKAIDFKPQITVASPVLPEIKLPEIKIPQIRVPQPKVTVNPAKAPDIEIDLSKLVKIMNPLRYLSDKAGKPLSVRLSDGKRFIAQLEKIVGGQQKLASQYIPGAPGLTVSEFKKATEASSFGHFTTTVTTAGTPVKVGTDGCYKCILSSDPDANDGTILVVGSSNTVRATVGNKNGIVLYPGNEPTVIETNTLANLWVDAEENGGKLCGMYFRRR